MNNEIDNAQVINVNLNSTSVVPSTIVESKLSVSANQLDIIAILLAEIGKSTDIVYVKLIAKKSRNAVKNAISKFKNNKLHKKMNNINNIFLYNTFIIL